MAMDSNIVSLIGNVVREPELRFTQNKIPVVSLTVAWNPKEGEPVFVPVTCWRDLAENVADTVTKGMRVHVVGSLKTNKWETKDGEQRERTEIVADELSVSQRFASKGGASTRPPSQTLKAVPDVADDLPF